jgi:hypothetical protein
MKEMFLRHISKQCGRKIMSKDTKINPLGLLIISPFIVLIIYTGVMSNVFS